MGRSGECSDRSAGPSKKTRWGGSLISPNAAALSLGELRRPESRALRRKDAELFAPTRRRHRLPAHSLEDVDMDDPPPPADRPVLRAAAPLWFQRAIACAK